MIGLGPIDRARIAATAAPTATPAVVSPTAAEGTVAASPFAAEGTEALSPRPPPKRRAEGTPSPATWWSARAGLFPGPLPGPPPGPGVSHPVFGPCGKQMVRWLVWIQGLWSAQRLCPCADPRAILCRTVLWTARAHYPRGTSRVRMNSFRRPVLSSAISYHCVSSAAPACGSSAHSSATLRAEKKRRLESLRD